MDGEEVFSKSFTFDGMAHTLRTKEVSDEDFDDDGSVSDTLTKTHASGWTISGKVRTDYFSWVNYFEAKHPLYGWIKGNFENTVEASSEKGYYHFYQHHTPRTWDYGDI